MLFAKSRHDALRARRLVEAFEGPAAVADAYGLIAANAAWRGRHGESSPEAALDGALAGAGGLFRLVRAARGGEARIEAGAEGTVRVGPLGDGASLWVQDLARPAAAAQAGPPPAEAPFGACALGPGPLAQADVIAPNAAFARIAGPAAAGTALGALFAADGIAALETGGGPHDLAVLGGDGLVAEAWLTGAPDGQRMLWLADATARRELEQRLAHGERLQAAGKIAGGVAHDLNNILTVVTLNTDDLLSRHPVGDPAYAGLQEIHQNAGRAAELVKMLLAWSRKQTFQMEHMDVSAFLGGFAPFLRRVVDERIHFDVRHARNVPPIRVDKHQLENVLTNLVVNARDAILKDRPRGKVTLRTGRAGRAEVLEALRRSGVVDVPPGAWAMIAVEDDGPGVPSELRDKIFEPFFTTKDEGKGTGIGLATVMGVIKQFGGYIALSETPGGGATFSLFLPQAEAAAIAEPAEAAPPRAASLAGAGRILFVEDEEGVRTIVTRLLTDRGYSVVEAIDGEDALDQLETHPGPYDLVISDVVMPGMDGPAFLKAARDRLGGAKVLFISGYAERSFAQTLEDDRSIGFLPKPFTLKQLAERVKQELHAA
jgi:two-component system, cell cycle sensor histidine kinase and response regulator CckA